MSYKRGIESPTSKTETPTKINKYDVARHQNKELTVNPMGENHNLNTPVLVDLDALRFVVAQELNKQLSTVKNEIKECLTEELDARFQNIPTKEELLQVRQELESLKIDCEQYQKEKYGLQNRLTAIERTLREKNLIFSNVSVSTNPAKVVEDICSGNLGVNNVNIKKVIKLKEDRSKNSSTILAEFSDESTVNLLLQQAKRLKGTKIGLSRDLPAETREARNILLKIRKEIQKANSTEKLNIKVFNNKLIVDNVTLILNSNYFGDRKNNIDGRKYLKDNFNVDFDVVKNISTNYEQ